MLSHKLIRNVNRETRNKKYIHKPFLQAERLWGQLITDYLGVTADFLCCGLIHIRITDCSFKKSATWDYSKTAGGMWDGLKVKQNRCFWNAHCPLHPLFLCLVNAATFGAPGPATGDMSDYEAATAFLGEWGRFQKQVFFLLCLSIIPNGFTGLSIVFLADTPPHRCLVPAHVNLSAAWRNSSIPLERDSQSGALEPSKCSRYKLDDVVSFSERGLLPGVDVNLSTVPQEGCLDGWEYDRSMYISTIVSEVCWPAQEASSVSMTSEGNLFHSIVMATHLIKDKRIE